MWDLIYKPLVYTAGFRPLSPPGNLMGENLQAHLDRPRVSNEMTCGEGGEEGGGGQETADGPAPQHQPQILGGC